ncbi:KN motif and ankyrin repeat domain-containing protein 4-like [Eucyclogobius newberryi]|uniref:KN motif and ankyrin repeat domain-containing protein 4-like n=1 Tax=Eucyclogobius newberryi TaxID=166745 RepID=UPI003B5B3431
MQVTMMEGQNGNGFAHKTNGYKGKPLYSVETPYGFQLDLDFLKYVDDIEKGNTIKRVSIQRRSKVPRASTLPRHLHLSSSGSRPSPWGSTGALGPRSRQSGSNHGYSSWSHDNTAPLSLAGFKSQAEMEARIKEFDEQPLGEHIRPHLLRASSLPLTVLLRQTSESTDDASSLRSSRDCLTEKNRSFEDLLDSHPNSGLIKRLSEALERVGELEMEVRVIPELQSQIRKLQEERERLRLALSSNMQPPSLNGSYTSCHYNTIDVKRPRHDGHISDRLNNLDSNLSHEWRSSTDLDELLTVTSLQAKVAALEQKLHESGLELKRVAEMLKEQQRDSKRKEDKIDELICNPGVWVKAKRVVVEQDGDETVVKSLETRRQKFDSAKGVREEAAEDQVDTDAVIRHIKQIRHRLDQQWDCLCEEQGAQHIDTKVRSLQQEMVGLVDLLSFSYDQEKNTQKEQHVVSEASQCDVKKNRCGQLKSLDQRHHSTTSGNQNNMEQSKCPREKMAAAQVHDGPAEIGASPNRHVKSGGTDGNTVSAEAPEKTMKMRTAPGEQMEKEPGSDTCAASSEVKAEFIAACQFLKDHMNNMDNPNDDMRKALVVLFQSWFGTAAEETSKSSSVAAHVRETKTNAPSLMAFLINLADDNGNTVLHYSVSHCNYSIVSVLLDTGVADVNIQNNAGYTAMMLASLTTPDGPSGMEVVRKLMELSSANIKSSQTGQTALHLAVRHGRVVMVRLLLSSGADANIQDKEGTTALMFASERGHTHIARLLLERSQCDLHLADKHGRTALSIATQGSNSDTAALLKAHAKARAL